MAASSSTCPALPASFYKDFGISQQDFQSAFDNLGDGSFRLKPGWSLAFTHAIVVARSQRQYKLEALVNCGRNAPNVLSPKKNAVFTTAPTQAAHQTVLNRRTPQHTFTARRRRQNMIFALWYLYQHAVAAITRDKLPRARQTFRQLVKMRRYCTLSLAHGWSSSKSAPKQLGRKVRERGLDKVEDTEVTTPPDHQKEQVA